MDYLDVAENIFNWLAQYQILQKQIQAERKDNRICFRLDHPLAGSMSVDQPFPDGEFFRCHGVALKVRQAEKEKVELDVYDYGGIFDPIDYLIPGDHYATTHFALLGSILFQEKKSDEILSRVKKAMAFHLLTSKDEYYFGDWGYHWDFQNYAFLEVYQRLEKVLTPGEKQQWDAGLKNWRQNTSNPLTNWVAMRAYALLMRHRRFNKLKDKFTHWYLLKRLDNARHEDGCYDDYRNQSRPIQYHVFTLALLHRMLLLKPNEKLKKNFLDGVNYFTKFIDPDGCFNYLGRGQEQNFGYAVAIYVLEAAKILDHKQADWYGDRQERVSSYLMSFYHEGHFPLVLNNRPDKEKFGWYDYHHLTVYNAFVGAWLALTHQLALKNAAKSKTVARKFDEPQVDYFNPTKNIIMNNKNYFVCLSGGTREYLSEPGITPLHIWFRNVGWVFSCPGGPSSKKYGKINFVPNIEKNFFAPLAKLKNSDWQIPAYGESHTFKLNSNSATLEYDYGDFLIRRVVKFEDAEIVIKDVFVFAESCEFEELRCFNFPVVTDKFNININTADKIELTSDAGKLKVDVLDTDFESIQFELREEIKTAKGLATVVASVKRHYRANKGQQKFIEFSITAER